MRRRHFPRILLIAGIFAGALIVQEDARAQVRPDPVTGAVEEDDAIPPTDPYVPGTNTTTDRSTTTSLEATQTSTTLSGSGTMIEQETTTIERETEFRTDSSFATPPPEATMAPGDSVIYVEDEDNDRFYGSGIGLEAGGGVNEFARGPVSAMTDTGGAWSARLTVGTRSPLAFEAAYIGTANRIQTLGLDRSTLMSNGAEGALKLHVALAELTDDASVMLKPYLLAGFAWKHYNLRGDALNTSSVQDSEDVFEVPIGFGLGWNFGHFIADQRFDFRPALSGDVVRPIGNAEPESMQTWSLTARVGVEF
jgi:hypothetical protein